MKNALHCGAPSVSLHHWFRALQPSRHAVLQHDQFRDRYLIGTYSGRSAIALACKLLGLPPGSEILVPAYNCGTELDALVHAGAKLKGYSVSADCRIDFADLISRKTPNTRAVYIIHYFGWEQPMSDLRRWCDEQGLLLIEDCALALFSNGESNRIGRMGDAAIYSLPKTLGFAHGGLLSLPRTRVDRNPRLTPAGLSSLLTEIKSSTKTAILDSLEWFGLYGSLLSSLNRRNGRNGQEPETARPEMPESYYFDPGIHADRAIQPATFALASSFSPQEIVRRRRSNFLQLSKAFSGIEGMTPVYRTLPDSVCPLSFPLTVANRDASVEALQARGIAAYPWWAGFHRNGIDWSSFPDACRLKQQLLTLPVHQGLDDRHISYLADTAVTVLKQENGSQKQ
ncbi:MAG: DegT/DnrJ/EryC1/StrS family aminotransferase [Nibricoccus sp.]